MRESCSGKYADMEDGNDYCESEIEETREEEGEGEGKERERTRKKRERERARERARERERVKTDSESPLESLELLPTEHNFILELRVDNFILYNSNHRILQQ